LLILALDTATLVSSVALALPDKLVAELSVQTKKTHSELLMPHIEQILSTAGIVKTQINAIAVSIGPGSFTGLRIGLATAKALAYALNIPIIGTPTLAAIANNCPVPGVILSPLLDAQKGNVYQGIYSWDNDGLSEIEPPRAVSLTEALDSLGKFGKPAVVMGEGAAMYRERILSSGCGISIAEPHVAVPRAASVAMLAHKMVKSGVTQDVMELEPLYIRRSEAEVLWERRHGKSI
jgi:tRNA threonylcarbamoyladenosine biosynthesis protein TsaB